MIWDDHQSRCIGELSFRSEVRAVRLRRDRVVVTLEHKVYVYNFSDLKLLHQIETIANPTGLCALSPNSTQTVLACPGLHQGEVRAALPRDPRVGFLGWKHHTSEAAAGTGQRRSCRVCVLKAPCAGSSPTPKLGFAVVPGALKREPLARETASRTDAKCFSLGITPSTLFQLLGLPHRRSISLDAADLVSLTVEPHTPSCDPRRGG